LQRGETLIAKELKKPIHVSKLEALLRRSSPDHPMQPDITASFRKRMAGYRGELAMEYPLSFLSEQRYTILYNLRLTNHTYYFQIDIVLLSPSLFLILEVKNIKGTLYFDSDFNQVIRTYLGKKESMACPILQVEHQQSQLKTWLSKLDLPSVPIRSLVVMSRPDTLLETSPGNEKVLQKVIIAQSSSLK
jgi:hypothetical protein